MRPIDWERVGGVPRGPAAVLNALRLTDPAADALWQLPAALWNEALPFCDRAQLTLVLGTLNLPDEIRRRIDADLARNTERDRRLCRALFEIAGRLEEARIEYVLLKGFSHGAEFSPKPHLRPQYDIDLYLPQAFLGPARDKLLSLGYEPLSELADFPTDHLPAMIRKTGWQWRGDFFDPEIPPSVDLHFRFWDAATECFSLPGLDDFWSRREPGEVNGRQIPVLHPVDRLGYAALHVLRHLLRGSLRIYHVYELAYFLDRHAEDTAFWNAWQRLHPPELRRSETIAFRLAWKWFGGKIPAAVQEEADHLPWMEMHAAAPVQALFRPNKTELWLHLALLDSFRDQWRVMRRRLVPLRLPGPVDSVYVPEAQMTPLLRTRRAAKYSAYVVRRCWYHGRTLLPTVAEGLRSLPFATFLMAANLYNFGLFIFFLLYNLHLLDVGLGEQSLGLVAGTMTVGTIAGSLPAAALSQRLGLKRNLIIGCVGGAFIAAARVLVASKVALLVSAFLAGVLSSIWIVALTPAVAHLMPEKKRPLGFSLWLGSGIATGILAGLLGSRLPGWLGSKQVSIWFGCAIMLAALWPLARLQLPATSVPERRIYPSSPFVYRYLLAFGAWQLGIGAFNPLFNAYFSRQQSFSVEQIGTLFAGSQLAQAGALFLAPLLLIKTGLISGISATQLATAVCLGGLAGGPSTMSAALLYAAYMSFQVMSEPGLFSLLMNRVAPAEHIGASALNFFVMFGCQAIAAATSGWLVSAFGYPVMLAGAAMVAAGAGMLSRLMLGQEIQK